MSAERNNIFSLVNQENLEEREMRISPIKNLEASTISPIPLSEYERIFGLQLGNLALGLMWRAGRGKEGDLQGSFRWDDVSPRAFKADEDLKERFNAIEHELVAKKINADEDQEAKPHLITGLGMRGSKGREVEMVRKLYENLADGGVLAIGLSQSIDADALTSLRKKYPGLVEREAVEGMLPIIIHKDQAPSKPPTPTPPAVKRIVLFAA